MTTWLLLNSIAIVLISLVLYITLRQVGFVLHRVGPPGARSAPDGPRVGEDLRRHLDHVSSTRAPLKPKLIVFGADSCSICASVRQGAIALAKSWKAHADIVLIYDCAENESDTALICEAQGLYFKRDCALRRKLGVTFVPFAIVVDREELVVGKGLVNEIGHLESLLELERSHGTGEAAKSVPAEVSV